MMIQAGPERQEHFSTLAVPGGQLTVMNAAILQHMPMCMP
jgi:hypothetical protein